MKLFNRILKVVIGLFLVINSPIGLFTDLKELGLPQNVYALIKNLWDTGFLMHTVKMLELACGLLFIFDRFIPLALVLIFPVIFNIIGIQIFMLQGGWWAAHLLAAGCVYLLFLHKNSFKALLK